MLPQDEMTQSASLQWVLDLYITNREGYIRLSAAKDNSSPELRHDAILLPKRINCRATTLQNFGEGIKHTISHAC